MPDGGHARLDARAEALCRLGYLPPLQSYKLFCPEATTEIKGAAHSAGPVGDLTGDSDTDRVAPRDVVVVGAGHNGLVAACYLARAGLDVVVLEGDERPGGGSRTEETVPGYRFDTHSVAHNIINMTTIPAELDLAGAGLDYQEMDPFSVAIHADGRRVRFFRSIEATVDSIAESSPDEARAYAAFMKRAVPVIRTVLPAVQGELAVRDVPRRLAAAHPGPRTAPGGHGARPRLGPYDSLLRRELASDLTRGPVAAFAAHAGHGARRGRRGRLRLVAGRLPPVRPVARPGRRPGPHRRPRRPAGPARRRAALRRPGGPHRGCRRAGAGRGHRGRRADRGPGRGHRHRPPGGPAGAARPAARRPGRRRPGRGPAGQRGAGAGPRGHRPTARPTPAAVRATGTGCRASSTASTTCRRRGPRPRRASCPTSSPSTPSPRRPSTRRWPPPATTPSTWPAPRPRPGCEAAGPPAGRSSSSVPSTRSRPGPPASGRASSGSPPARPT